MFIIYLIIITVPYFAKGRAGSVFLVWTDICRSIEYIEYIYHII